MHSSQCFIHISPFGVYIIVVEHLSVLLLNLVFVLKLILVSQCLPQQATHYSASSSLLVTPRHATDHVECRSEQVLRLKRRLHMGGM